jgi:aldehyde dehydrogenase (NAD+)
MAGSRIFVQDSIYDKFVELYKERVGKVKLGCYKDGCDMGPIINKLQFERVLEHLKVAKEEGLHTVTGGGRHGDKGYFIQPTIFSNVKDSSRLAREEIFGPVSVSILLYRIGYPHSISHYRRSH